MSAGRYVLSMKATVRARQFPGPGGAVARSPSKRRSSASRAPVTRAPGLRSSTSKTSPRERTSLSSRMASRASSRSTALPALDSSETAALTPSYSVCSVSRHRHARPRRAIGCAPRASMMMLVAKAALVNHPPAASKQPPIVMAAQLLAPSPRARSMPPLESARASNQQSPAFTYCCSRTIRRGKSSGGRKLSRISILATSASHARPAKGAAPLGRSEGSIDGTRLAPVGLPSASSSG
mmetsp:Transcript_21597/g.71434  ORF Transcript_21597/g.71434 Transcript_21597/m.71434 type:complete len:238 (+) Transcript_21597:1701-2414(+)